MAPEAARIEPCSMIRFQKPVDECQRAQGDSLPNQPGWIGHDAPAAERHKRHRDTGQRAGTYMTVVTALVKRKEARARLHEVCR
jgi:hypothetical protein